MKVSFFKIFAVLAVLGEWSTKSLLPDEDGVVRVTADEAVELVKVICTACGWKAEIVVDK